MKGNKMVPRDKEFDPEDPMELVGIEIPGGDLDQLLDDIIQEYLFIGWTQRQIMSLFQSPYFAATHQIYRHKGEAYVKEHIRQMAERWNQGWIPGPVVSSTTGGERDA